MKKFFCLLVIFLFATMLFSCTAPINEAETTDTAAPAETTAPDATVATETSAATEPQETETEAETEAATTETIVANPYPDTVYVQLSSEDIDTFTKSLGGNLPFELKSSSFITETERFTQTVKENQPDKTFALFGIEHNVKYQHSMVSSTNPNASYDVYKDGSTTYRIFENGLLQGYNCQELLKGTSKTPQDEETARQIAANFVETYYSEYDFSEYTVSTYQSTGHASSSQSTLVKYIKRTHGYFIGDKLEIHINSDGIITVVHAESLGCSSALSNISEQQLEIAREQLINSIITAARSPLDTHGQLLLGSDGSIYMYMYGTGWTFNDEGMIDENSQKVTETYYVRLNP